MSRSETPEDRDSGLWHSYRSNLPRHLLGVARYLQAETLDALENRHGHAGLRLSFEPYISLIGSEGCRLTELAAWLSISKQACSQTANEIELLGYIRRDPDPEDRRAKRLVLTSEGRRLAMDGALVSAAVEARFAELLGGKRLKRMSDLSARLFMDLPETVRINRPGSPVTNPRLAVSLARLSQHILRRLMELTREKGHPHLKLSFAQVLNLIGPLGGNVTTMARYQKVSKQAISAVAGELEKIRYLVRRRNPEDARHNLLQLTPYGVRLLADSVESVSELEGEFLNVIGERGLTALKSDFAELYRKLGIEQDVFAPDDELHRLAESLRNRLGEEGAHALGRILRTPDESISDDN